MRATKGTSRKAAQPVPAGPFSPARLAAASGVSTDALRFYERQGLLPAAPRSLNGRRVYPESALQRVQVVRAALSLGFTVAELREVFRIRQAGGSPCKTVCEMAATKLADLEQNIAQLMATRDVLAKSLRAWQRKLHSSVPGARMGLLDLFAAANPERSRHLSPRISPGLRRKLSPAAE